MKCTAPFPRTLAICLFSLMGITWMRAEETLTQYSTIEALLGSVFKGQMTLDELEDEGDFGIGTFNDLDGEMILLDEVFYKIAGDGSVHVMDEDTLTPYASVCEFDDDEASAFGGIAEGSNYKSMLAQIDTALPSLNLFYAVKIEGRFSALTARSVSAQKEPYLPLAEIVKTQSVFEFTDVEGTLVGFRCPSYAAGINVPGYHFHFLRKDKKAGGHVLGLKVGAVEVRYITLTEWNIILPETGDFLTTPLGKDVSRELTAVETAK